MQTGHSLSREIASFAMIVSLVYVLNQIIESINSFFNLCIVVAQLFFSFCVQTKHQYLPPKCNVSVLEQTPETDKDVGH